MLHSSSEKRTLSIILESNQDAVFIKISDTGQGIEKQNLEKIFSYGFTTKETGHGFGLHTCANYMREMGGRMWAESEGIGKGAMFILRFPKNEKHDLD